MKSEKQTTENILNMRDLETSKELKNELFRVEEELKRFNLRQNAENKRIQQKLNVLKAGKNVIHQNVVKLHQQLSELEITIGHKDQ